MRINISNPADCCGCTACESICAHNAIKMKADQLGFLYPQIDDSACVDCGLCNKVCMFKEEYQPIDSYEQPEVYGVRHIDEEELAKSQSGAAFWAFAEYLLEEGYIIYGVGYDKNLRVIHKRVENKTECQELRGSKYTQSDLRGIFREIKKNLQSGEKNLFVGTPCQVAGLKSYIPKRLQDNLLTIDLVCHAVPSPKVWEEYVKWIENKYKDKVVTTNFRNKKFGWHSHFETFLLQRTGNEIARSTFRLFFYEHLSVRRSCANCKFTSMKRPGDLTIGDFWGWEQHHKEWNDNKGVNLLLVNTEKGKSIFEKLDNKLLHSINSNTSNCLQPQLVKPIVINGNHEKFTSDFIKRGFEYVAKKYGDLSYKFKIKQILIPFYRIVRKFIS
jgi:coenzyme F420-reducing hydrogenase beta subunit